VEGNLKSGSFYECIHVTCPNNGRLALWFLKGRLVAAIRTGRRLYGHVTRIHLSVSDLAILRKLWHFGRPCS
jgi:hypothetical protein